MRRVPGRALLPALAIVHILAAACVRGTVPATELYRIAPSPAPNGNRPPGATEQAPLAGTLAVMPYETRGVYAGRNIVYRVDDHEYGTYPHREWAIPLADMLGMLTQERLARQPLTAGPALFDPSVARSIEYVWRGTVREFEEADRGRDVFAAVALDVQLVRTSDNSILWSGTQRLERQVQDSRSMEAIVATLSALATEAVDALIRQASGTLRPQPAPAATAPATPQPRPGASVAPP